MLCEWLDETLSVLPSQWLPAVMMDLDDRIKSLPDTDGHPILGEWVDRRQGLAATEVLKVMQKHALAPINTFF